MTAAIDKASIDYEAEYNNRTKVPDHPAYLAAWTADAAAFRAAHAQTEADLPYGPSPRQRLDLFWPDSGRDAPLAMFIHGGYWQGLDKSWVSHLARGLVAHGVAVAMPSYDLCPDVTMAVIVQQMQAAVAMLHHRHRRPVYAIGHSAGGHLAAMLLATDWTARNRPAASLSAASLSAASVSGAYTLSGLFDLVPLVGTSVNTKLGLDAATARSLSPVHLPPPPGLLHAVVGALEGREYARQSRAIAEAWHGTATLIDGRHHFDIVAHLADPQDPATLTLADRIVRALPA